MSTLPITVAGAGLPKLTTVTGDAKIYAERMFTFPDIGSLIGDQAKEALQAPVADEGVAWADDGVRSGSTSDSERAYLRAMAELGTGPVRTSDVAKLLGKSQQGVGPVRDLIKRALCYAPRFGEISFTVPLFDQYMKRWIPALPQASGGKSR